MNNLCTKKFLGNREKSCNDPQKNVEEILETFGRYTFLIHLMEIFSVKSITLIFGSFEGLRGIFGGRTEN